MRLQALDNREQSKFVNIMSRIVLTCTFAGQSIAVLNIVRHGGKNSSYCSTLKRIALDKRNELARPKFLREKSYQKRKVMHDRK